MEQLTEILHQATAAIGAEYFLLAIHGADPVYRERVYCYELYHQMRRLWPVHSAYRLNGEVDKGGHPYFQNDRGKPKPDLLVHVPGGGDNHAVIEVKPSRTSDKGIRKDLKTLSLFCNVLGYERAIYLVYGPADETLSRVQRCATNVADLAAIQVWLHMAPSDSANDSLTLLPLRR
jgi:hypothetical protein